MKRPSFLKERPYYYKNFLRACCNHNPSDHKATKILCLSMKIDSSFYNIVANFVRSTGKEAFYDMID